MFRLKPRTAGVTLVPRPPCTKATPYRGNFVAVETAYRGRIASYRGRPVPRQPRTGVILFLLKPHTAGESLVPRPPCTKATPYRGKLPPWPFSSSTSACSTEEGPRAACKRRRNQASTRSSPRLPEDEEAPASIGSATGHRRAQCKTKIKDLKSSHFGYEKHTLHGCSRLVKVS